MFGVMPRCASKCYHVQQALPSMFLQQRLLSERNMKTANFQIFLFNQLDMGMLYIFWGMGVKKIVFQKVAKEMAKTNSTSKWHKVFKEPLSVHPRRWPRHLPLYKMRSPTDFTSCFAISHCYPANVSRHTQCKHNKKYCNLKMKMKRSGLFHYRIIITECYKYGSETVLAWLFCHLVLMRCIKQQWSLQHGDGILLSNGYRNYSKYSVFGLLYASTERVCLTFRNEAFFRSQGNILVFKVYVSALKGSLFLCPIIYYGAFENKTKQQLETFGLVSQFDNYTEHFVMRYWINYSLVASPPSPLLFIFWWPGVWYFFLWLY